MILTKLEATAYRMHSPRWASQPKSGQGIEARACDRFPAWV